jgi:hypothetical protein
VVWLNRATRRVISLGLRKRHDVEQPGARSKSRGKAWLRKNRGPPSKAIWLDTQSLLGSPAGVSLTRQEEALIPSARGARTAGKGPLAPSVSKPSPVRNSGPESSHCSFLTPGRGETAILAPTSKHLAQSNKSLRRGQATNIEEAPGSAAQFRALAKLANGSVLPAIS